MVVHSSPSTANCCAVSAKHRPLLFLRTQVEPGLLHVILVYEHAHIDIYKYDHVDVHKYDHINVHQYDHVNVHQYDHVNVHKHDHSM
ncbi:hypothetical protein WR25_06208 [Diploscapter pachys]|uniref:Uncharacterized protein n=1 Tax=Diploscapter pachys TaxID=2018661 RepID=A0A2A2L4N9_9BILA|nr:hypothetical protein WR25_06208 [Diploscapter pachys]